MVGLAALAEAKQKEAKDQIRELLASRSRLLESNDNGQVQNPKVAAVTCLIWMTLFLPDNHGL